MFDSSWRSCSDACTHDAMETVRAARMHAHRATRQLCAAAYHGGGATHSASGVCTHDATETAHSRSHVCVHAHLTTSSHARRTHDLPAASNEQKLRSDRNFLAWCRTRAPEGAAWRCREIVAWREQVCGGPTIYGHHFPAARVSARAHSRVKACLCTWGAALEAWGCVIVDRALEAAGEHGWRIFMT